VDDVLYICVENFVRNIQEEFHKMAAENVQKLIQELQAQQIELEIQNEDLRKAYEDLEKQVQERTAELEKANRELKSEIKVRKRVLRKSEERFRAIYENAPLGIYRTTPYGKILDANPTLINMLGYASFEELAKINLESDQYHPEYPRQTFRERIERDGEIKGMEAIWRKPDGSLINIRENARAIRDAYGHVAYYEGTVEDISDRKQAQDKLRESEDKYRQLFENESDAVMIFDAETLRFEDANPATLNLYGYSKDEFLLLTAEDISAEKEKTKIAVQRVKNEEQGSNKVPLRYFRKNDGTIFPGEIAAGTFISGGRKKIIGAVRDITDRMRTEEALRESETRYRNIFENIQDVYYEATIDGIIQEVSPSVEEISSYNRDELLGKSLYDIYVDPQKRDEFVKELLKKEKVADYEVVLMDKSGTHGVCSVTAKLIRDKNHNPHKIVGSMRNITGRKQAENHIHILSQQLLKAQETERQMISLELHDRVAQDLSAAKINCDLLLNQYQNIPSEVKNKIIDTSATLQKTIRGVRDLAYDLRPPGLEKLGLMETVYQYCQDFSEKLGLAVDFEAAGMTHLNIDHDAEINIYRLVQEGLANIQKHAAANRVAIKLIAAYPNILLRIEDDGKGFDLQKWLVNIPGEKRMGDIVNSCV